MSLLPISRSATFLEAPTRRSVVTAGACVAAVLVCGAAEAEPDDARAFQAFVRSIEPEAEKAGIGRSVFEAAIADLAPDPVVPVRADQQPEFETPLWVYLDRAAGAARVEQGRRAAQQWRKELSQIERRSGVPSEIVLAAWGMESDFRQPAQQRDVLRSLATLAWRRPQAPTFKEEFIAALTMLDRGFVTRPTLKGSWAGAMGMPQFMPSAYLRYGVRYSGEGAPDIWASVPDSLASIANFLRKSGWTHGLRWGFEVLLPPRFAWASLQGDFAEWRSLGLVQAGGAPLPAAGKATLFAPAGAEGPSFLLSSNYWVLKDYNNSDSYALSLGRLADSIAGGPALREPWPKGLRPLARNERVRLQHALAAFGFYHGESDGKIGPATRDAVHAFQLASGQSPADGLPAPKVLDALDKWKRR